ncbi:DNA-binding response regulator [Lentzea guizhouensis]|uniref:DNA-binding response regulator n=1 Tax=Lentzea guizhouensis TaxID=1586287 RepID=A0A1B2I0K6_9PSEU|nr:response regulator transcription factor [Lentzea guizhouensis]ANZ43485.1 DNA-binding response regulator [Lentzea guizhouensis]
MLVEDYEDTRVALVVELEAAGFAVDDAEDIAGADRALRDNDYDCVVFDRLLPDGDSITYVHRRRREGWATPVLFLTQLDSVGDRVAGFDHGGDDYVVKPCDMAVVTARVQAMCRRAGRARPSVLRHADLEVDCAPEHVEPQVSRSELIEHCWDASTDPMSNVVDQVVKRVRQKLLEPELIHTVRGVGFRLEAHR